ncbi:MAG: 2-C-methyl-D-erythritol 2,4-cyclodiphosphate synthase [Bacteroidetes bacterium]|nr:MAG: 2-C-methyl-D-erythritol 2,4-cyclodiphosphate synthase [Bacteroidota bacterium]PIE88530.1 MAG: 2-C-methyl-D-erythritol 2,4-cyclodiphosphate synthase [Bacteroidota bacterium]
MFRIGFGYDVHRLEEGRDLILGGVRIPYEKGGLGHSDADGLVHALCDALLGALSLGDIGNHFPDTDPRYKGVNSLLLLEQVMQQIREKGYALQNADMTLALQKPKVAPYIEKMRMVLSKTMGVELQQVSVKATTTEKMGFEGRGEGFSAYAVVMLQKI